jgi:c(7)-type cytochrome triheme protein
MRSPRQCGGVVARVAALGIATVGLWVTAAACDPQTRYRVLTTFVDGVPPYDEWLNPKPEPPRKREPVPVRYTQRAAALKIGAQPSLQTFFSGARPAADKVTAYAELVAMLPKDVADALDWDAALQQGLIAPVTSLTPGESGLQDADMEVDLKGPMPVKFAHAPHTKWLACENCHTDIFEMAAGTAEITMDDLNGGKYCGVCHGKVAFETTACARCHPDMGQ